MLCTSHRKWLQNFYGVLHAIYKIWLLNKIRMPSRRNWKSGWGGRMTSSEFQSNVQGRWADRRALAYCLMKLVGEGLFGQQGRGIHSSVTGFMGDLQQLWPMLSPPVIGQGINPSSSHQENLVQWSLWRPSPWKQRTVSPASPVKGLQLIYRSVLLRRRKTLPIKADLLKQSSSAVQPAIKAGKWCLSTPDSGKQAIFLFFLQTSQGGTFTSRPQLPVRHPAREGEQPRLPSSARVNADPLGLLTSLFTVWSHLAQANIKIFCF